VTLKRMSDVYARRIRTQNGTAHTFHLGSVSWGGRRGRGAPNLPWGLPSKLKDVISRPGKGEMARGGDDSEGRTKEHFIETRLS